MVASEVEAPRSRIVRETAKDFSRAVRRNHRFAVPIERLGAKVVYLNAPARALLQELPRLRDDERVIAAIRADSAGPAIDKVWSRVRKVAGLAGVRLHDLRHSFASVGAAGGLSLPIIGALLGHKHTTTTARYAHLSADDAAKQPPNFLAGGDRCSSISGRQARDHLTFPVVPKIKSFAPKPDP